VKTPVMFCGVNAKSGDYGYPAANVSGILERGHFRESIALVQQFLPEVKTIGFMVKDSPSGQALRIQIERESSTFTAEVVTFELAKSLEDITKREKLKECDAIFVDSLMGIRNQAGEPLDNKDIIKFLTDTLKKPVVGANNDHLYSGALCADVKSGQEQGEVAAEKLLSAMKGTPVSAIPVTRKFEGKRVINVTAMKRFGVDPKPVTLLGATLIRTNK
jgi:ABC-type uncharacterized transport system substrate-binding protein